LGAAAENAPSGEDGLRYALACRLRDLGFDQAQALARLSVWNEHECRHPRDPALIEKAVTNAFSYARDVPGNSAIPTAAEAFAARITPEEEPDDVPEGVLGAVLKALRDRGFRAHGHTADQAESLPPPTWLVPDFIIGEGFTLLFGPQKHGKSFVALDLALSIVHGRPWLDTIKPAVEPGSVLYLALEGMHETLRRTTAWCRHYGVEPSDRLIVVSGLRFSDEAISAAMREAVAAIPDLRCIIIDTVARAMVGLDENLARDQGLITDRLDRLAEDAKVPVIAVHHSGKDVERGTRGSNALPAAAVGSVLVTKRDDGNLAVSVTEIRRGESGKNLLLRPLKVAPDAVVWQARPDMPADTTPRAPVQPAADPHKAVLAALIGALCAGVSAEVVSEHAFYRKVVSHAEGSGVPAEAVRRLAERLMDTLPVLRECKTGSGVALLRPEDKPHLLERLEKDNA